MFSKFFKSARSLIRETSEPDNRPSAAAPVEPPKADERTVEPQPEQTNHQAPREEDPAEEETIVVYVPTPSTKKRRRLREEPFTMSSIDGGVTPSAKKRKVLPLRSKEEKSPRIAKSYPVVEIPVKKLNLEPNVSLKTPAKEIIEIADTDDEDEDASPQKFHTPMDILPKKHRRFGSEDPVEAPFSTAPEVVRAADEEDDEDEESDDEAPEAVGIQDAAKNIREREKDAAKAVKEQKTATRQKRKERDQALKKQSISAKKRKLVEVEDEADDKPNTAAEEDAMVVDEEEEQENINPSTFISRSGLPQVLPAEFLEDDDDEPMIAERPKRAKKTKFTDVEKQPKDRRVGKTTYRVTKSASSSLAPKASAEARSTKEAWMQGRNGGKANPKRKVASKGFFKK